MKILVTGAGFVNPIMEENLSYLASFADEVNNYASVKQHSSEEIEAVWEGVDGIIAGAEPYTADMLSRAPKSLKVISRYGVGYDNVDVEAATRYGIKVTNTPGLNSVAVSELAIGLMISLVRFIPQYNEKMKSGVWSRVMSMGLDGSTLGIIGLGAIGKRVALVAKNFDMNVIAYNRRWPEEFAIEHGIERMDSADEVLKNSDIVSLHVPITEETAGMINSRTIGLMRNGAFLINTARGEIVDFGAVNDAIMSGKLGGFATDVYCEEPPQEQLPMFKMPNVILTSHVASFTKQAAIKMGRQAIENLKNVLETGTSPYLIN